LEKNNSVNGSGTFYSKVQHRKDKKEQLKFSKIVSFFRVRTYREKN